MKINRLHIAVLVLVIQFLWNNASGQSVTIKKCYLPSDTAYSLKVPLNDVVIWSDSLPLITKCDNQKQYKIHQYIFSIIYKNPMQVKEFGVGNDGVPILAKRAIKGLKPGDTIFLKNVIGYDENDKEIKLPNIVFTITDETAIKN